MPYLLILFIVGLFSYLIGSIPFALAFNKLVFKQDPRDFGSKNIGALNTLRIATQKKGKAIGALSFLVVFFLDAGKGALTIILTQKLLAASAISFCPLCVNISFATLSLAAVAIACFFSILGHNYSAYIKFQGGRGAATLFGIILYLSPILAWYWFVAVILFMIIGEILAGHKLNKKLIPNAISNQIIGRLLGEIAGVVLIYFLNPSIFLIVFLPLLLVLIAHKDRLKEQIKNIKNKTYLTN
ncbi:MAG: glycerol-3-phosphate acyltransferase [Candidatus Paceibacterota bacterium]